VSPLLLRRLSDETLGRRLAAGEAAAFDELYRRYAHRLSAYGAHLLGDGVSGDDVAQASLLKAYGALRDGRVPERMRPWLYRIAHNTAIDLVARRRELPSAELPEPPGEDSPDGGALVTALAGLPDRQRRVYVLREIHGLRIDETAAELGLTGSQVEQALFAARNRLAELLVFGERLSCVAVRRLAAGPLEVGERRALKTHLRSCPACRGALGRRALTVWPVPSLDWLPRLMPGLGGLPATAKVGAAVATATFAAGASAPMVLHDTDRPATKPSRSVGQRAAKPVRAVRAATPKREQVAAAVPAPPVALPPPRPRPVAAPRPERRHAERSSESRGPGPAPAPLLTVEDVVPEAPSHSGPGPGGGDEPTAVTTTPVAPGVDNSGPGSASSGHGGGETTTTAPPVTTTVATTVQDNSGPGGGGVETVETGEDHSGPGGGGADDGEDSSGHH
jgi:RNA polymerase sigma factor (sigma-70 family)